MPQLRIRPSHAQHVTRRKLPELEFGAGRGTKRRHHGAHWRAVVRAPADVTQGEVALWVEDEVSAHLRPVELLRTPEPSPQDPSSVAPDHARRGDREQSPPSWPEMFVALSLGVGEPQIGMTQVLRKAPQVARAGKRDYRHAPIEPGDLPIELPQLREMLLAIEST